MNRFLGALSWVSMFVGFAFAIAFVVVEISRTPSVQQFLLDYGYQLTIVFLMFSLGVGKLQKLLEQAPAETLRRDGVAFGFMGFVILLGCAFAVGVQPQWTQLFFLFWTSFTLTGALLLATGISFWKEGQKKVC